MRNDRDVSQHVSYRARLELAAAHSSRVPIQTEENLALLVELRPAQPDDAMAVARVHVGSWQAAYRNLLPDEYLDGLRPEDRARMYDFATVDPRKPHTIVATEDGLIRGFATTSPSRDSDLPDYGELCALYVDPEYWGRGFGLALVSAARGHLSRNGFEDALLWMLAGNVRAEHFYRRDGWAPDGMRKTDSRLGVMLYEVRYRAKLSETAVGNQPKPD